MTFYRNLNIEKVFDQFSRLSFNKMMVVMGTSFVLASGASIFLAHYLLPGKNIARNRFEIDGSSAIAVSIKSMDTYTSSAEAKILKRNIFNHERSLGDATEDGDNTADGSPSDTAVKSNSRLKLFGVIFSGSPDNGMAFIENTAKNQRDSYVVGDIVMTGIKLLEVYPDRVILDRDNRREYLEIETTPLVRSRRDRKKAPDTGMFTGPAEITPLATRPPPEAYKEPGFERKGHDIVLSDTFKRDLLGGQLTKVLQDAKAVPNMVGGEIRGFRLERIREDSIYQKAGIQSGDIIHEINGTPLTDASGAIRILQHVKNAKDIEVRVERSGAFFDMTINVQ